MEKSEILAKANLLLDKINDKINDNNLLANNKSLDKSNSSTIASASLNMFLEKNRINYSSLKEHCNTERLKHLHINYLNDFIQQKLTDISIIEAFHGTDIKRISATSRALNFMLQSNPSAKEFIFVEAQRKKTDAVFSWLRNYGVKYVFKTYDDESNGLFLKTALWNIGVEKSTTDRFCFIDSDIVFCNQDWLKSVDEAFKNYDVLSLAGYCYYENDPTYTEFSETIGHKVMSSEFNGHIGFNIGMTRSAYEAYGKFEAFNMHDDTWIWQKILGTINKTDIFGYSPYKTPESMKYGLPFKVGSTEEVCCHLNHGNKNKTKAKLYGIISYLLNSNPFEDIEYDTSKINVLPKWSNSAVGQIIKDSFNKVQTNKIDFNNTNELMIAKDLLAESIEKNLDLKNRNIVVFSSFVPNFNKRDIDIVLDHKMQVEKILDRKINYVCFTESITTEDGEKIGLDVIPFSSSEVKANKKLHSNEIYRKDISIPKKSAIVFIDIEDRISHKFNILSKISGIHK